MTKVQKIVAAIVAAIIALTAGALALANHYRSAENQPPKVGMFSSGQQERLTTGLTGVLVKETVANRRPVGVVIENHPETRPQFGLSSADVVFEAIAEGGITRFLALYQSNLPDKVGPVRSARTYFAQLANTFASRFAHVGGNSDALAQLKNNDYKSLDNIDQFFHDTLFWRNTSIAAPHNVFTNTEKLANRDNSTWQLTQNPLPFGNDNVAGQATSTLTIPFSTSSYDVQYRYDTTSKQYTRYLASKPHVDAATKNTITTNSILVLFVAATPTQTDTVGSQNLDLAGGGSMILASGGQAITGTWSLKNGRYELKTSAGTTITIPTGKTWVELVNKADQTRVTWQ
jgi:hypothetical protein